MAFTLIELLAVIAIIGVLAGIIIVAVRSGISRARNTQCISNLRQLGMAMGTYRGEHNGHLYDQITSPSYQTWTDMLAPYVGVKVPEQNKVPTGVWACPESDQVVLGASYSHYSSNYVSFGTPTDQFPIGRSMHITSPSKVIAFTEGLRLDGQNYCTRSIAPWNGPTAGIAARHNAVANVVYFDLHVGQLDPKTLPPDSSLNRTLPPWH